MEGRISIHRKILDREWYDDINTKVLFIHLLLTVNIKDKQWRWKTIERWSRITSIAKLSKEIWLSIKQIRLSLDKLISTSEIDKQTTNEYTKLSITKYNDYQGKEWRERANERQTEGKQRATTKEDKNIRNKENNIYMFDEFWKEYPKKRWKDKAIIAWKKIKPSEYDIVIEWAKLYASECKRLWTENNFIKYPQWWLNDKRWLDSYEDNIEPNIWDKKHYDWYKQNIIWTKYTDIDWTEKEYKEINYRRFLIYDRNIERPKATEIFEKVRWEYIDFTF